MFDISKIEESNIIVIKACNVVKKEEYKKLDPVVEKKHELFGKIRMIVDAASLDGILLSAFWEDLKLSLHHPDDFEKVAVVCKRKSDCILKIPKAPLISSEIKVFEKFNNAQQWISNESTKKKIKEEKLIYEEF